MVVTVMADPRACAACGAPAVAGRVYPDGQHWVWVHLGYCPRGRLAALGTTPCDETGYLDHGAGGRYEPGDYLQEPPRSRFVRSDLPDE